MTSIPRQSKAAVLIFGPLKQRNKAACIIADSRKFKFVFLPKSKFFIKLKIAVYNIEWMRNLFEADGTPTTTDKDGERSRQLAEIIDAVDPDFPGVVEGPNTLVIRAKMASAQLDAWTQHFLPSKVYKRIHGFPSAGQQKL